jgi:hypothetical protein
MPRWFLCPVIYGRLHWQKRSVIQKIPGREEEGGVGDAEQQKNNEDASDELYNKEHDGKKR